MSTVPSRLGLMLDAAGSGARETLVAGSYVEGKRVSAGGEGAAIFRLRIKFGGTMTSCKVKVSQQDPDFPVPGDLASSSNIDGLPPSLEHEYTSAQADGDGELADSIYTENVRGSGALFLQVEATGGALTADDIVQARGETLPHVA